MKLNHTTTEIYSSCDMNIVQFIDSPVELLQV